MGGIRLIVVPYEVARFRVGVGRGPETLLEHGAEDALRSAGACVRTEVVKLDAVHGTSGHDDVGAAFALIRSIAERVRQTREDSALPIVLGGSCIGSVGAFAGLSEPTAGVVWLDAHPDFNHPDSSTSGYLDGMGLSVLTGGAWQGMLATVPGAHPLPETRVVLAGARAVDPAEETRLATSQIVRVSAGQLRSSVVLEAAIASIMPAITGLHLHIDLDVLDSAIAGVNVFGAPGGIDGDELHRLVATLAERFPLRAVTLTAYDPACDVDARVPPIACRLLRTIAETRIA